MTPEGEQRLIKAEEDCKLTAYWDAIGKVWTWGWGETGPIDGVMPHEGATITQAQADAALRARLANIEWRVENFLARSATPAQFDAMISLAYNAGLEGFVTSDVLLYFNKGDLINAAQSFAHIIHGDNNEIEEGLVNRRAAEIVRFCGL